MSKGKSPQAVYDVSEQREIASGVTGYAKSVQSDALNYQDPATGQRAQVGVIDPGKAQGRARDYQFEQRLSIIKRRHSYSRIPASTIINFLPVQLKVNSPIPELNVAVRAASRDEQFTWHTWFEPVIQTDRLDEKTLIPTDFVPAQMAEEFVREYQAQGGVMVISGTINDLNMEDPKTKAKVGETLEAAFRWMGQKVAEAWNFWNTPNHNQSGNITEVHRTCAQVMFDAGRLGNTKPTWMELIRSQDEVMPLCPVCRSENKPGQLKCSNPTCDTIFDIRAAYEADLINELDLRLERLDRATLADMGISDYVAESKDEKPERVKKGLRKPLSKVEQRYLDKEAAAAQKSA
jgi:hypothetical protein